MATTHRAKAHLLLSSIIVGISASVVVYYESIRNATPQQKMMVWISIVIFFLAAVTLIRSLTTTLAKSHLLPHLGVGRTAVIQYTLRIVGYISVVIISLTLLGISVSSLLLGGAAIGIILGVAAQQALGNFFASIVLTVSRPFSPGDEVSVNSGAMGGKYEGTIKDIGVTHTALLQKHGEVVLLPNTTVLTAAAIIHKGNE